MATNVFRVDDRRTGKRGPFINARLNLSVLAKTLGCKDPSDIASVQDDVTGFVMDKHVCGFLYFCDVFDTFAHPMRRWLHDEGYVLSVYSVPDDQLLRGRQQCAFSPTDLPRKIIDLIS